MRQTATWFGKNSGFRDVVPKEKPVKVGLVSKMQALLATYVTLHTGAFVLAPKAVLFSAFQAISLYYPCIQQTSQPVFGYKIVCEN